MSPRYTEDVSERFSSPGIPFRLKILFGLLGVIAILGILSGKLWENNQAGVCTVKQAAFSGELTVVDRPGIFFQGFGSVEQYKQAITIGFGHGDGEGAEKSGPINVQFNDAGTAKVFGNARFELPIHRVDPMLDIHTQYRTNEHLTTTLLQPWVTEVCVLTASMFSTEDTYGGNKSEYIRLCQDQLQNGKYQTDVSEQESEDPITKEKRRVKRVSIRMGKDGQPLRLENPLARFEIKAPQFLMTENFDYDPSVQKQIEAQREAFMKTNTARAEAQRASQDAITARAKGDANIATARAEQLVLKETETVKAEKEAAVAKINADKEKAVATVEAEKAQIEAKREADVAQIAAEQRLKVATLDKEAAEQAKLGAIAKGQGEAEARKLVLAADGALTAKLEAWVRVNQGYASALGTYRGNLVPSVVMGGGGKEGNAQPSVNDFIALMIARSAQELGLNIKPDGATNQAVTPGETK